MRYFYSFLLLFAVVYFSSCGRGGEKINNLTIGPPSDTSTKGSVLQISWIDNDFQSESYNILDLTVLKKAYYELGGRISKNGDSTWSGILICKDFTKKKIDLNLNFNKHDSIVNGVYTIDINSSTLTDYALGENRVYAIAPGSTITLSTIGSQFMEGSMDLTIYSKGVGNHHATGSFKVFY